MFTCLALAGTHARAASLEQDLVGHWPLRDSIRDVGPHQLATAQTGVRFTGAGPEGRFGGGAWFDGRGAHLEVAPAKVLQRGTGDFTVALWLHTDEAFVDDPGDLVSQYDSARRTGFQLSLRNNTGVTSSQSNTRQLQFGIDAGTAVQWRDEGRPGQALLAYGLTVHDGHLYAGTTEVELGAAGRVYRYRGPHQWEDLGSPDPANTVSSLISYRGRLYVATAKYRVAGSSLPESPNPHVGGGVFRLEDDGRWTEVGRLPDCEAIAAMVVYRERLYASSQYKPAGFFRYESDGDWTSLPTPGFRVQALAVHDGYLWATSWDDSWIFRYDGETWKSYGKVGGADNTQTYSFAILGGRLCVGTWPSGKVYRLSDDDRWEDIGQLGQEKEVMAMTVHNGQLYAGTLPLAEIYRYDGGQTWTRLAQLDLTPDVRYRRVWTMAQYQGRLFSTTLPSGKIHSMEAGQLVTYDRSLPPGWRHVAAIRAGSRLQLWVDGQRVAESAAFDAARYDLANAQPLLVGNGPVGSWEGRLSDVRLYHRALSPEEIRRLAVTP